MPTPPVSTVHLKLPDDFEYDSYEAVHSRIGPLNESHQPQWSEYVDAWSAIATRFYACAEYDDAFTRSIKVNAAPQQPERSHQERDLFGFFVTGLSIIESTCYGLYAIASMLDAASFPIAGAKDKRTISPEHTSDRFRATFPNAGLSRALHATVNSQDYRDWKEIRNILAHRGTPGRTIHATVGSGVGRNDALWTRGIALDASTTPARRLWLAGTLRTLLQEANLFVNSQTF